MMTVAHCSREKSYRSEVVPSVREAIALKAPENP